MRAASIPLLFLITLATPARSQNGVSLLDSIDPRHGGPGPSFGFFYASCWGYVAPDGHEYALLGAYSGTVIIDLDSEPIREAAYIPGANSEWKELKTWGHYAYVVSEGNQGVQIINLSQLPDTAWLVRSVSSAGGRSISRNHSIAISGGTLYLNGSTGGGQTGGTIMLSLADPENPIYVGEYQPAYLHDVYVLRDTLYGAAIYGGGVYIASVTNKAAPQTLGVVTYPNSGTHNTWVSPNGRFLFTTDEIGTTSKNMKVFELTGYTPSFGYTPRTPFTANPSSIIHNIHGRGNYVYIAHYASGVYVADVHDPLAISNAGGYDTYTGTSTGYIGCWGVYPYFPSGRWIASDTQTGLYLFAFAGLQPRTRSPLLSPADGDTLAFSPVEEFRWRAAARQADDPHEYRVRISGPGLDTLVRTPDTSFVLPALPSLQEGGTYSWHLTIADEFTAVSGQDTFRFVYGGNPLGVDDDGGTPAAFGLGQNFPNPFNPSTTMHFVIPAGTVGRASLHVYDVLGRQVATLLDGPVESGAHAARFDGSGLASGVYLVRLAAGGAVAVRKMLLAR